MTPCSIPLPRRTGQPSMTAYPRALYGEDGEVAALAWDIYDDDGREVRCDVRPVGPMLDIYNAAVAAERIR